MTTLTCEDHALLYTPNPPHCTPGYNPAWRFTEYHNQPFLTLPETGFEPLPLLLVGAVLLLIGVSVWVFTRKGRTR